MNIIVHPITLDKFYASTNLQTFEFISIDILRIEAKVKYLHVMDEINAKLMEELVAFRISTAGHRDSTCHSSMNRLQSMALYHYEQSLQCIPSSVVNYNRYESLLAATSTSVAGGSVVNANTSTNSNNGCNTGSLQRAHMNIDMDVEEYVRSNAHDNDKYLNRDGRNRGFGCCQS